MTELADWAESTTAEMKSWRAKGGKWDQMAQGIKQAAFNRTADGFEETAWGDAERPTYAISYSWEEADEANLEDAFDKACLTGAAITWGVHIPHRRFWSGYPEPTRDIWRRTLKVWGELPPYIEITDVWSDKKRGGGHYSIKPVWEL